MCRHVFLGTTAAIAVLVVAFGGAGLVARADGGSVSGTVYFDTDMDGQRGATPADRAGKGSDLPRSEEPSRFAPLSGHPFEPQLVRGGRQLLGSAGPQA